MTAKSNLGISPVRSPMRCYQSSFEGLLNITDPNLWGVVGGRPTIATRGKIPICKSSVKVSKSSTRSNVPVRVFKAGPSKRCLQLRPLSNAPLHRIIRR